MFDRKGLIAIERDKSIDEDDLTMLSIELDAEDFEASQDGYEITTRAEDFNKVKEGLEKEKYEFAMAEVTYIPQTTIELNEEDAKNMEKLIDMLEDNDDVQDVFHNWED